MICEAQAPRDDGSALVEKQLSTGHALTRRDVMRFWKRAGAAAAVAGTAAAARPARAIEASADVDPNALLTKLVRRITMGFTPEESALAESLGYTGYLEHHLNHTAIDDSALDARLAPLSTLGMTYQQLYDLQNDGQIESELIEAVFLRATLSTRQLFQRMVEFWRDHFNIPITEESRHQAIDHRDVISAHALGTFPAMLQASAMSPAMLRYLNNDVSTVGDPNENYARELMELHTMGVDGGYTQHDVEEVARCFTGWTLWYDWQQTPGTFRYRSSVHDQGQKVVLGNIIPANGGMQDGLTVLNILANHPSTRRFIARKLCRWLLGEHTPSGVIDSVATAYASTGGDIKAMIRAALRSEHLADAEPKFKRPFHLIASAFRAQSGTILSVSSLRSRIRSLGHHPFEWLAPDGFPDSFAHWSGLLLLRWNFGASLLNNNIDGASVDAAAFFSGLTTADQMVDRINHVMFGGEMPPLEQQPIHSYLAMLSPITESRQRDALGLAIAAPSFQWY